MNVGHRVQHRVDVVRNGKGDGAVRVAGEGPVQVALIDRRDAGASHGRGQVGRRHDDEPAADGLGVECVDQAAQRNLPFVFVAMIAGHQKSGRAGTVADDRDRNGNIAVGRARHRVRILQPAVLTAVFLIVDTGPDLGGGTHGLISLFVACLRR